MTIRMNFESPANHLASRPAEQLVLIGVRCWMAGYEHGDIQCWETAWRHYSGTLGTRSGRLLLSELQYWVRVLRDVSVRPLSFYPHCCRHVCADEWVGLSVLSAFQHHELDTARAGVHRLSGLNPGTAFDLLTDASSSFAAALSDADQILLPMPLHLAEYAAAVETTAARHAQTKALSQRRM